MSKAIDMVFVVRLLACVSTCECVIGSSGASAATGSFLRIAGPEIGAGASVGAHALPPPTSTSDEESNMDDVFARGEANATASVELGAAVAHAESTALTTVPNGNSTFTPEVNTSAFYSLLASGEFDDVTFNTGLGEATGIHDGLARANFQLSFDQGTQGEFHGFLYLVASVVPLVTANGSITFPIGGIPSVQSSITIANDTYTANATYRPDTDDWALNANLPGGVIVNMTVGTVNHHFDFVVPINDGTLVTFTAMDSAAIIATASPEPFSDSIAEVQLTLSGLAWGIARGVDMPPVPGDFDGDGDADSDDYDIWSENVGIEIGAGGPQGDADLDGDIDQDDLAFWLMNTETGGIPGDYNGDGRVDAGDYVRWRNNLGDPTEANINNSGDGGGVTISDYTWWKQYYGHPPQGSGGSGSIVGVPEPSSVAILMIGLGLTLQPIRKESRDS